MQRILPGGRIQIRAVTIDAAGNTYLTGNTNLKTLPSTSNAVQPSLVASTCTGPPMGPFPPCNDAFIVKLDPSGNVLYATYWAEAGTTMGSP